MSFADLLCPGFLVSLPAGTMLWLAGTEAEFLRGKYLWANWDMDELKERADSIAASEEFNIQLVGWPFGKEFGKLDELVPGGEIPA